MYASATSAIPLTACHSERQSREESLAFALDEPGKSHPNNSGEPGETAPVPNMGLKTANSTHFPEVVTELILLACKELRTEYPTNGANLRFNGKWRD